MLQCDILIVIECECQGQASTLAHICQEYIALSVGGGDVCRHIWGERLWMEGVQLLLRHRSLNVDQSCPRGHLSVTTNLLDPLKLQFMVPLSSGICGLHGYHMPIKFR